MSGHKRGREPDYSPERKRSRSDDYRSSSGGRNDSRHSSSRSYPSSHRGRGGGRSDSYDRRNDRSNNRSYGDHRTDRSNNHSRHPNGNDRRPDHRISDRRPDHRADHRSDRPSQHHSDRGSRSSRGFNGSERNDDRHNLKEEEDGPVELYQEEENDEQYQKQLQALQEQKEESEEEILRKARERRQAILEKYKKIEEEKKEEVEEEEGEKKEEEPKKEEENGKDEQSSPETPKEEPSLATGDTPSPESPGGWFFNDDEEFLGEKTADAVRQKPADEEWQDESGYFLFKPGTLLGQGGRYKLVGRLGVGQYSNVFRAIDCGKTAGAEQGAEGDKNHVAIKMLRHIDQMSEKDLEMVALNELKMLQLVANKDPKDKYSCVRLLDSFEDKEHLCLVFESLELNLRELMHQYGKNIGLNIDAVRLYGRRLALALYHLKRCDILHADFKLDNVMVGEDRRVIKLGDFGCASFSKENTPTPLLVSRYYRPPEVILGLPYSFPMDLWSLGCTLYELYTGKVCFAGDNNNEMIKMILDLKGLPSKKLIKKAQFRGDYFDEDFSFLWEREDRLTGTSYVKKIPLDVLVKQNSNPARDLKAELLERFDSKASNKPRVLQLYDLLDKIFTIDPTKRITIEEVLRHPFITTS